MSIIPLLRHRQPPPINVQLPTLPPYSGGIMVFSPIVRLLHEPTPKPLRANITHH